MAKAPETAALTADPAALALLLDLDGTLAPIIPDPDSVAIPPGIRTSLTQLVAGIGLVAFISGRSLSDLRRIVGMTGVVYSGNHGTEIVDRDGMPIDAGLGDPEPLRAFASHWGRADLGDRGIWLEDKGRTLTFHYRNAADPEAARAYLDETAAPDGRRAGLRVEPGRMSLEVHPAGDSSKGTAVRAILDRESAIRSAISVGDDRTDVTVWHMLDTLRAEGRLAGSLSVGVLSAETPPIVSESADTLIEGVAGTERFLAALVADLGRA